MGGAEFVQKSLIETVSGSHREGDVSILFISSRGLHYWDDLAEGPHLHKYVVSGGDSYLRGLLMSPWHILRICRRQRIATAFASQMYLNTLLCLLKMCGLLKARLLVRESTQFLKRFGGFKRRTVRFMYRFYHAADTVIVQTPSMQQTLRQAIPTSAAWQIRVMNNPLSIAPIDRQGQDDTQLPALEKPFVVAAGRLIPEKGYDLLLSAFATLPHQYHLYILGDGPQEQALKQLIHALHLEQRVHLPGHTPNPIAWFRQAHTCVVSSRIEGFPNTLLQMMTQCGRVVSTHCTGEIADIPHILTCPVNAVDALASALQQAIALDEATATENTRLQREYIEAHHNFTEYQHTLFP